MLTIARVRNADGTTDAKIIYTQLRSNTSFWRILLKSVGSFASVYRAISQPRAILLD